jgi:hypothetical protein
MILFIVQVRSAMVKDFLFFDSSQIQNSAIFVSDVVHNSQILRVFPTWKKVLAGAKESIRHQKS